jgi:hypothetical protein
MAASNDVAAHLSETELALLSSPVISEFHIVLAWTNTDDGYIRIRATLLNDDFLEASEYFVQEGTTVIPIDYRYQWMDQSKKVLRRRWDNTPHYPGLPNFPHHIHVGNETAVVPGHSFTIIELLDLLEDELLK